MLTYILFFLGFFLLIKGADLLVGGASSVAQRFGISALVIGLTIVSFGTSAPELVVNILASMNGNTDISIGNIMGSNIANILLILGISAMIYPLRVQSSTVWKEIPFAILAVVVVIFVANDALIDGAVTSVISRIDGLVLISFFVIFLYYIFTIAKANPVEDAQQEETKQYGIPTSVFMILAGLAGLVIGGGWIVDGAVLFATQLGASEALIGLTIIAVGTSLPELATSAVAAYRKNVDIAVGNIIGSNIFNIFWILGLSSIISPLPFSLSFNFDLMVTLGATLILFFALFVGKRHVVQRSQGLVMIVLYVVYIICLIIRG